MNNIHNSSFVMSENEADDKDTAAMATATDMVIMTKMKGLIKATG